MNTSGTDLNEMELKMLKEFRKALSDVLTPKHTDAILLKWLRARNFNLKKCELLFRQNLWGRAVYKIDTLRSNFIKQEVAEKYEFTSYLGAAKDGTPLRYIALGRGDFYGFLMSMSTFDILLYCTYLIEHDVQRTIEQTEKVGREINEITYIFDLEYFSVHQYAHASVIELGLDMVKNVQDYYPEIWKNILAVNVPFFFYQAFNILRPILSNTLLQNIRVASKEATPELLLEYVDPEVLPAFLGGQRVDSKDDPMCSEFIKFGGIIPEEYYLCKQTHLQKKNFETETVWIAARSYYNHPIVVQETDSIIRVDVRIEGGSLATTLLYRPFGKDSAYPEV
ncbi:SEC14-like protein 2 isoform X2 [Stegodyphus dumicola]|uniref:SEC14-like protein 2 isoform X2 n=1 Tax=Stegodyphus dumicola TaxID=202533 RepID=UPI0015ADB84C|nr:SEC14-like protein 2 isoform X2 [Stegodyphus dumicola]